MLSYYLSEAQLNAFSIIERVCSVCSLLGCIFIIGTFCMSKSFHKPINRLIFYASIGNMMTNVATLMAREYVGAPSSFPCQFQSFLIQMFMPADAFWSLAMAVNVYLTFYYKFDARQLRKMEIPYLLVCYGIPFIVALVYVFISSPTKGRMYGNATLWCWITQSWDIWRIATFYGPVWVTMGLTFFVYIRAGREIYRKHKQLKDLNYTSHYEPEPLPMNEFGSKTTEVSVTSEIVSTNQKTIDLSPLGGRGSRHSPMPEQSNSPAAYSVSISARPTTLMGATSTTTAITASTASTSTNSTSSTTTTTTNSNNNSSGSGGGSGSGSNQRSARRMAAYEANNAAWSYTKCAILFFTAMLVTWIPSSANRVYSVLNTNNISLTLEYMSAFVLPLQGFWNAIIYITTSWKACKTLAGDVSLLFRGTERPEISDGLRSRSRLGGAVGNHKHGGNHGRGGATRHHYPPHHHYGNYPMRSSKSSETESMEEFAHKHGSV